MSGIAGIIHFDGAPVEPGQIEKMTAAMAHRGPDGIRHWSKGSVALGQCMLRTTPESLEETQPLTNEDESLILVMDGRVDNWEELRRELLARGAVLRTRADAELVLRALEAWGEDCPDRIIGEYAFFVWDARKRRLFGARDAAGTRHFYYHAGRGWFAFASEIKGLLALGRIEPRLNESRVFDYLVPEFDRDDVVGTFYQDILRLPAGHAMTVGAGQPKTWRWWNPGELPENRFASLDECVEAFLEQMRVAVKCRLRHIGPVGAMLSGGLDSSSIVGLIRTEFRGELSEPLRTFSLIREDRENCKDWEHIQHMLREGWIDPTIIASDEAAQTLPSVFDDIGKVDEPFLYSHGLTYPMIYRAAKELNCRVVLDGMAGDLLFYNPTTSLRESLRHLDYSLLRSVLSAWDRHDIRGKHRSLVWFALAASTPEHLKVWYRRRRQADVTADKDLALLRPSFAQTMVETRRALRMQTVAPPGDARDQQIHARVFTGGLLSFGHETYGQSAHVEGIEPRSPFSDRRMIEFAIQMPLFGKAALDWYKNTLRLTTAGQLPEALRWRADLGNHPGWRFYQRLISELEGSRPQMLEPDTLRTSVGQWVQPSGLEDLLNLWKAKKNYPDGVRIWNYAILAEWIRAQMPIVQNRNVT